MGSIKLDEKILPSIENVCRTAKSLAMLDAIFSINDATFCYWRRASDSFWNKVHHPSSDKLNTEDGSVELMSLLVGQPSDYQRWALEYYELSSLKIKSIVDIFHHSPLNQSLVLSLNSYSLFEDVLTDAKEIGYPVASS